MKIFWVLAGNFLFIFQDIDYEGFRKFLDTYLDVSTPDELSRHLYLSFVKKSQRGPDGKAFKVRSHGSFFIRISLKHFCFKIVYIVLLRIMS